MNASKILGQNLNSELLLWSLPYPHPTLIPRATEQGCRAAPLWGWRLRAWQPRVWEVNSPPKLTQEWFLAPSQDCEIKWYTVYQSIYNRQGCKNIQGYYYSLNTNSNILPMCLQDSPQKEILSPHIQDWSYLRSRVQRIKRMQRNTEKKDTEEKSIEMQHLAGELRFTDTWSIQRAKESGDKIVFCREKRRVGNLPELFAGYDESFYQSSSLPLEKLASTQPRRFCLAVPLPAKVRGAQSLPHSPL